MRIVWLCLCDCVFVCLRIVWCVFVCYTEWWLQLYICCGKRRHQSHLYSRRGVRWFGVVWCGMTRYNIVWHSIMWYGMIWTGHHQSHLYRRGGGWRTDNTPETQKYLMNQIVRKWQDQGHLFFYKWHKYAQTIKSKSPLRRIHQARCIWWIKLSGNVRSKVTPFMSHVLSNFLKVTYIIQLQEGQMIQGYMTTADACASSWI